MKNISVLLLSLFCFAGIYAQDAVDDFFDIKIGMSEEELIRLVGTSHTKDAGTEELQDQLKTTDIKRLAIYKYSPKGTDVTVEYMIIMIYESRIFAINVYAFDGELEKAFIRKYGKPEIGGKGEIWKNQLASFVHTCSSSYVEQGPYKGFNLVIQNDMPWVVLKANLLGKVLEAEKERLEKEIEEAEAEDNQ